MGPRPPPSPGGKSSEGMPDRPSPREPSDESLCSRFSPTFTALMAAVFMDRLRGASSPEPGGPGGMGGVGPQGSMETLALSSRQAAPPGTPLESRAAAAAATVEMDTLGSDLSLWGGTLPWAAVLPLTEGEMGMISSSLLRMALEMDTLPLPASFWAARSACDELLAEEEEEEAVREEEEWTLECEEEVAEEGCLSAMRLAMP